jgi:HSP20 family protein
VVLFYSPSAIGIKIANCAVASIAKLGPDLEADTKMKPDWLKIMHVIAIGAVTVLIVLLAGHLILHHFAVRRNPDTVRLAWPQAKTQPVSSRPLGWNSSDHIQDIQRQIDALFAAAFNDTPAGAAPPTGTPRDAAQGVFYPFERMEHMRQEIDAMFDRACDDIAHFGPHAGFDDGWDTLAVTPAMEWSEETNDAYLITISLPDMDRSSIRISLTGPVLNIVAESQKEKRAGGRRQGAWSTSQTLRKFERHVRLPAAPADIDAVKAVYSNGLLQIRIPKAGRQEPLEKPIPIQ